MDTHPSARQGQKFTGAVTVDHRERRHPGLGAYLFQAPDVRTSWATPESGASPAKDTYKEHASHLLPPQSNQYQRMEPKRRSQASSIGAQSSEDPSGPQSHMWNKHNSPPKKKFPQALNEQITYRIGAGTTKKRQQYFGQDSFESEEKDKHAPQVEGPGRRPSGVTISRPLLPYGPSYARPARGGLYSKIQENLLKSK